MIIAAVLDEIGVKLRTIPSIAGRVYTKPTASFSPPAAVVTLPVHVDYDASRARGRDRVDGSIVVFVGRPENPDTRDLLTPYLDGAGAESVKAAVEGDDDDYTSCDGVSVTAADTDIYTVAGIDMVVAVFEWNAYGPGGA